MGSFWWSLAVFAAWTPMAFATTFFVKEEVREKATHVVMGTVSEIQFTDRRAGDGSGVIRDFTITLAVENAEKGAGVEVGQPLLFQCYRQVRIFPYAIIGFGERGEEYLPRIGEKVQVYLVRRQNRWESIGRCGIASKEADADKVVMLVPGGDGVGIDAKNNPDHAFEYMGTLATWAYDPRLFFSDPIGWLVIVVLLVLTFVILAVRWWRRKRAAVASG